MGASASKAAARTAGAAAAQRRYPTTPTTHTQQQPQPSQAPPASNPPGTASSAARHHPSPRASASRDAAIDADARDPHLAGNLRSLGAVQPSPTFSPSAAAAGRQPTPGPGNNAALATLDARRRLEERAEAEATRVGKDGFEGRRLLDVGTIRRALVLRDEKGLSEAEVEGRLGLAPGVVGALGRQGVFEAA